MQASCFVICNVKQCIGACWSFLTNQNEENIVWKKRLNISSVSDLI